MEQTVAKCTLVAYVSITKTISSFIAVNACNKDGASALHFAAGDGSIGRLTLLFENS